ncbi:FecR family protein [Phenylobacterium sp.]|uniref:FecR family protein n=1 Tax=Phenylobacterium sp. TaxID=1871053 RepID=UPI002DE4C5D8|nr:FecR domain-containing protein [Phenylobacterium sp.]
MAEAADWVIRLQAGDLDGADGLAFDAWLQADDRNATAYDAALAIDQEFETNAAAVREGLRTRRPGRVLAFRRPYYAAGAAAAAAFAAALIVPAMMVSTTTAAYATGTGEHRTVSLADGSKIDLDASSRLSVTLGRHERQVTMAEGQAVFDVTHDSRRPFLIAAGDRTVRVVGTQFDVRHRAGHLSVTVTRGTVEVLPADGASGQTFRLHPGQRLEHQEGAISAQVAAAAPDQALGWRSGRLVYRDQPLSIVVADLNAEFAKPIRIADPALAATPVSGVFIVDSEDAVVRRLALLVSAHTVPSDGGVTLKRNETPNR